MKPSKQRLSGWRRAFVAAALFWVALTAVNLVVVYIYGPHLWANASYFFGTTYKATLGIIMFVEGALLLAAGLIWASGSMETTFQASNLSTNPYYHKEDWKQRKEQTQKENTAGKALILAGAPIFIASIAVVLA